MNMGMNGDKTLRRTMEVYSSIVLLNTVLITYPSHLSFHKNVKRIPSTHQIQVKDNPGTYILVVSQKVAVTVSVKSLDTLSH